MPGGAKPGERRGGRKKGTPNKLTGDMPPISEQICFQLHPFSRLISSSFSVRSARVMAISPGGRRYGARQLRSNCRATLPERCSHRRIDAVAPDYNARRQHRAVGLLLAGNHEDFLARFEIGDC
jgi:hypothetical protein